MKFLIKFLESFGSKTTLFVLNLIFLTLSLIAILIGMQIGFFNEIFQFIVFRFSDGWIGYLPLKPITLFLYSLMGFALTLILLLRNIIAKLSSDARYSIAVLLLIPEAISFYEFFNTYTFWITQNFIQTSFFIFTTKFDSIILFFLIGLQILLLRGNELNKKSL